MKKYLLNDGEGKAIGEITEISSDGSLVLGVLSPVDHFAAYQRLFKEHEVATNRQQFIEADRLEGVISGFGFYLTDLVIAGRCFDIEDLQIMGNYEVSFHIKSKRLE